MSIGEFGRAAGLTPRALRLYDEMGLVRPAEVDELSGYRYHRAEQLDRARLVARLRLVGMPLPRIEVVADLPSGAGAAELGSYWRQVEADTASRRALVAVLVEEMRSEESDVFVDDDPRPVAAARTLVGSRDDQLDAVTAGRRVFAVADGFGSDPGVATRALGALAVLERVSGLGDPVRVIDEAVTAASAAVAERPSGDASGEGSGCTLTALVLGAGEAGPRPRRRLPGVPRPRRPADLAHPGPHPRAVPRRRGTADRGRGALAPAPRRPRPRARARRVHGGGRLAAPDPAGRPVRPHHGRRARRAAGRPARVAPGGRCRSRGRRRPGAGRRRGDRCPRQRHDPRGRPPGRPRR